MSACPLIPARTLLHSSFIIRRSAFPLPSAYYSSMRSTLFYIPAEIAGMPVFGFGLLLALWGVGSVLYLGWLIRRQGFNADTRSYLPVILLAGLVIAFVLPAICDERGFPIRGYGVMLGAAVAVGVAMAVYRGRRMGIDPELIISLAFWLFAAGIVGGRLFYVIEYWDRDFAPSIQLDRVSQDRFTALDTGQEHAPTRDRDNRPRQWVDAAGRLFVRIVSINTGGLVVYGALVLGGLALLAFIRKYHVPGLALADLIAPSVVLGLGIGRLGCFLNGCCFGGLCDLPWAVTFPKDSPAYQHQVITGQMYGLVVTGNAEHRPVIADVQPDTPAAGAGLHAGALIRSINGQPVATLDDAQRALARAFDDGGNLELVTDDRIHRLSPLAGTTEHSRPVHPCNFTARPMPSCCASF